MKFNSVKDKAKYQGLGRVIEMLREMERRQSESLDSAQDIQEEEGALLDEADPDMAMEGEEEEMEGMEEEVSAPPAMDEMMEDEEEDEFEKEKKDFMTRDNKIGRPSKGPSKMILMLQGQAQNQKKGFKGAKGF